MFFSNVFSFCSISVVRLWSLLTWTNVVAYKGHCFPVWDVKFSPLGYYFASCSHDRSARLWATDNYNPLRYFVGHFSDVDVSTLFLHAGYVSIIFDYFIVKSVYNFTPIRIIWRRVHQTVQYVYGIV